MKYFNRILRTFAPKSVLLFSLIPYSKTIKLQDQFPPTTPYNQNISSKVYSQENVQKTLKEHSPVSTKQKQQNYVDQQKDTKKSQSSLQNAAQNVQNQKPRQDLQEQNKQKLIQQTIKLDLVGNTNVEFQQKKPQAEKDMVPQVQKQNQAIIGKRVPQYIIKYLKRRGLKIHTSSEIDEEQIILYNQNKNEKVIKLSQQRLNKYYLFAISNHLSPIKQISNLDEAKQLLSYLQNDETIISVYLPTKHQYQKQFSQKLRSSYDSFSKQFHLNVQKLQNQFNELRFLSSTKKNAYVIIRDKQVAQYLKVNINKVGIPHVLYNSYQYTGNQPNCKIDDKKYTCTHLQRFIKSTSPSLQQMSAKINEVSNQYINNINIKEDLIDKIRQIQQTNAYESQQRQKGKQGQILNKKNNKCKKLLVVKVDDQKQQFQKNVDKVLEKVARLMKNQVIIVKTQNQQILKQILHVAPDDYATIRLFDLSKTLPTIVPLDQQFKKTQQQKSFEYPFFLRFVMKGPFQIENICQFINNCQFSEPYFQKNSRLSHIKPFYPGEFQMLNNGVLLFSKFGCNGCSLAQNLFTKVLEMQQLINHRNLELTKQICIKYKIQKPQIFANLNIRKYNILNEDSQNPSPQTTPKVFVYENANTKIENANSKRDIKIDEVFSALQNIQKGASQQDVHDSMVEQIIERLTKTKVFE